MGGGGDSRWLQSGFILIYFDYFESDDDNETDRRASFWLLLTTASWILIGRIITQQIRPMPP